MKERVKELRTALGLTLEKFGKNLGVGKTAISKIENGENSLTEQMLISICNTNWNGKFVNEDWLRGNSDQMFRSDTNGELEALAEKYQMSDLERAFVKQYFDIPPDRRQIFFKTLDEMFLNIHASDSGKADTAALNTATLPDSLEKSLEECSDEEIGRRYRESKKIETEVAVKYEVS